MRRRLQLQVAFVAVAVLLLIPVLLLVRAGLGSVGLERDFRHRIVAQRIVDEMERELTTFLTAEEDRPYDQYRFYSVRSGGFGLERSPLATPPTQPFVIGHFQIEPDGQMTSPLVPRNESLAASKSGWSRSPAISERMAGMQTALDGMWTDEVAFDQRLRSSPSELAESSPVTAVSEQPPGSTLSVSSKKQKRNRADGASDQRAQLKSKEAAPFRAIETLNSGALSRQQRLAKVESSEATDVYNFSQAVDDNALQAVYAEEEVAADESLPDSGLDQVGAAIEQALKTSVGSTIKVRQEPMIGRRTRDGRLVLYRTVLVSDQAYRQGLVVDQGQLLAWLGHRVLPRTGVTAQVSVFGESSLAPGDSSVARAAALAESTESGYWFRHRFAEPFGSLTADLTLQALPETRTALYLYGLSAIVALAATFGLLGLYRTVAVSLSYAERRNNFVSAVTHELKTPLTSIRMYGEMLRDGLVEGEEKRQNYYRLLTSESERLTRLLNNVLELSQLERGQRSVRLVLGNVAEVVEEVAGLLRPHAESEGFVLEVEIEPDLPSARFDRDGLKQVLFNLVDNAMKYSARPDSEAGRQRIRLRCHREHGRQQGRQQQARGQQGQKGNSDERSRVVVSVVDHGPGVAREHLKKIFEPFYRPEDERTRQSKGTGIGLSLVQGLVEEMGGTVRGLNRDDGFEVRISLQPGV